MRKSSLLILFCLMFIPTRVNAATQYTDVYFGSNLNQCTKLQDNNLGVSGVGYFSECMKVTCGAYNYNVTKYDSNKKVVCRNGNSNPYWEVVKDGCGKGYGNFYTSACNNDSIKYCTKVTKYDCNRKSDGSSYTTTTKKPTSGTSIVYVNSNLKSLLINNMDIGFKGNVYNYTLTIGSNVDELSISATPEDSNANILVSGNEKLVNGSKIIITVTVDGYQSVYTLTIEKEEKIVSTKLKSLTLSNGSILFNKDVFEYDITVEESVKNIEVSAVAEDSDATISISGNNDLTDNNVISIVVSDNKGNSSTYKIKVSKQVVLSNNANLKNLIVNEYPIDFSSDTKDYQVILDNGINYLTINYELEDSKSSVEIVGNSNLQDGSKINVNVVAEDGTMNSYTIFVKFKKQSNFFGILFIIILIIALGFGGYYVYKKFFSGKKEEKYKYE